MNDVELSWLAAMWEGEGSIVLYTRQHSKYDRKQIVPSVTIANTDILIINKIKQLLQKMGCEPHFKTFRRKKSTKDCHSLTCNSLTNIKIVLEHIIPFMVGEKKAYGEIVLDYVSKRLEKIEANNNSFKHTPYDKEDFEFVNKKNNVRSSTTTRETPKGEDIVCS